MEPAWYLNDPDNISPSQNLWVKLDLCSFGCQGHRGPEDPFGRGELGLDVVDARRTRHACDLQVDNGGNTVIDHTEEEERRCIVRDLTVSSSFPWSTALSSISLAPKPKSSMSCVTAAVSTSSGSYFTSAFPAIRDTSTVMIPGGQREAAMTQPPVNLNGRVVTLQHAHPYV